MRLRPYTLIGYIPDPLRTQTIIEFTATSAADSLAGNDPGDNALIQAHGGESLGSGAGKRLRSGREQAAHCSTNQPGDIVAQAVVPPLHATGGACISARWELNENGRAVWRSTGQLSGQAAGASR